jgi:DNA-binding transcriptional regulator LsrR (DeoR family)
MRVALEIADHINAELGFAYPSQERIALRLGMKRTHVNRAVAALVAMKLIIKHPYQANGCNKYELDFTHRQRFEDYLEESASLWSVKIVHARRTSERKSDTAITDDRAAALDLANEWRANMGITMKALQEKAKLNRNNIRRVTPEVRMGHAQAYQPAHVACTNSGTQTYHPTYSGLGSEEDGFLESDDWKEAHEVKPAAHLQ